MTTIPIPAGALEAAAKAIAERIKATIQVEAVVDLALNGRALFEATEHDLAAAALSAAFGVGEIRQQWRPAWEYRPTTTGNRWIFGSTSTWTEDRETAEEHVRSVPVETRWSDGYPIYRNPHLQSRYVLSVSGEDGWTIETAWRNTE